MFTEQEIEVMLENEDLVQANKQLKKDFKKKAAPYLDISNHDFFSLVMITPCVGLAMADGKISLKEELALNKKARKLSKGKYFLKKDPVVDTAKYLIKHFVDWEDRFNDLVKMAIYSSVDIEYLKSIKPEDQEFQTWQKLITQAPYFFIRYLSTFFLDKEDALLGPRKIRAVELEKIRKEGEKLGFDQIPLFQLFCSTYNVEG